MEMIVQELHLPDFTSAALGCDVSTGLAKKFYSCCYCLSNPQRITFCTYLVIDRIAGLRFTFLTNKGQKCPS